MQVAITLPIRNTDHKLIGNVVHKLYKKFYLGSLHQAI